MKKLNLPKERTFIGPASVWKRLLAFFGDLLIINLLILFPWRRLIQKSIPQFNSYSEAYNFIISNYNHSKSLMIISLAISLFGLLYFTLLEYKFQQTPGKMLFNISVVSDTTKLAFWQCLVRSLFLIPIFPFFLLWIIDPLFMCITKTNQRLSEILSKTKTIDRYIMDSEYN